MRPGIKKRKIDRKLTANILKLKEGKQLNSGCLTTTYREEGEMKNNDKFWLQLAYHTSDVNCPPSTPRLVN